MNNYKIPNLVKACEILMIMSARPEGISSTELEAMLEIPRSTAFRILKTLCSEGMAEKRGKLIFSGPSLIKLGLNSLRSLEIRSLSVPFLNKLAIKTDFTAHLAIPSGWQSLILEVRDSSHPVRVASRPGTTVPLYCSSTGKVFLAYRYENDLDEYFSNTKFEKYTNATIVTLSEMKKQIEIIKKCGYAVDKQEFHEDVWCLASPVRDNKGQVIASIGVTGPFAQACCQDEYNIGKCVKEAARGLSVIMGYHDGLNERELI